MKNFKAIIFTVALFIAFSFSGCKSVQNANNTQKGVAIGATTGAVIGGILGNNLGKGGNTAMGAVIGGVVGGAAGGVIGNKMDTSLCNSLPANPLFPFDSRRRFA